MYDCLQMCTGVHALGKSVYVNKCMCKRLKICVCVCVHIFMCTFSQNVCECVSMPVYKCAYMCVCVVGVCTCAGNCKQRSGERRRRS